ncbi:MAG: hypothetical protein ABSB67_01990 [Bryobacteraceae bacterium]|jgi:hypothetical protein
MAEEHLQPGQNGGGTYEHSEADVKLIVYSTLGLIVGVVIVCLVVVGVFKGMQEAMPKAAPISGIVNPNRIPPEPRLQPFPALELQALRQHEDDVLSRYGWVDQKAGVVRIPIDKAMDIMVQRGFPTQGQAQAGNASSNSNAK